MTTPDESASDELAWWSAADLAAAVAARQLSPVEIAQATLARVEAVNPGLNAVVHHDPDTVLARASELEADVVAGHLRGPLHGVPYLIKDLDDVAGAPTSYGIPFLRDVVATESSVVAERMAAAGGLYVGKTNSPELGYRGTCRSHAFGATSNPWRAGHTPGGSSGGSAAAVAAGLAPLADGSDGAGSIRIPAALCGTVGFKPSFGRVPAGLGFDQTIVHHGPLARSVADAALMFSVVEGAHPSDPRSIPASGIDPVADLVLGTGAGRTDLPLAGLRVAWAPGLTGFDVAPDVAACAWQAAATFGSELGAEVVEAAPPWGDLIDTMWVLWQNFYGQFAPLVPAEAVAGQVDEDLLELMAGGTALTAVDLHRAAAERAAMWSQLVGWFEDFDLLVLPTLPLTAFPDDRDHPPWLDGRPLRDRILAWLMTYPFNLAAPCPVISVPCGFGDDGLPVGLSMVGRPWDDIAVLRAAACFEAARPPWSHAIMGS